MSNPYVFPPFGLVGPVLKFLYSFRIPFIIVVLQLSHYSFWWPELLARSQNRFLLGGFDAAGIILAPSIYVWIHARHLSLSFVGL